MAFDPTGLIPRVHERPRNKRAPHKFSGCRAHDMGANPCLTPMSQHPGGLIFFHLQ